MGLFLSFWLGVMRPGVLSKISSRCELFIALLARIFVIARVAQHMVCEGAEIRTDMAALCTSISSLATHTEQSLKL